MLGIDNMKIKMINYVLLKEYVRRNYKRNYRQLMQYIMNWTFEEDVKKLMNQQKNNGEPLSIQFGAECMIDSYAQEEYGY